MTNEELAAAIDGLNISSEQLKAYIAESGSALNVRPDYPDTMTTGQKTLGEFQSQLTDLAVPGQLTVKAVTASKGAVYIGNSFVTKTDGYPLSQGESITLALQDISMIFATGEVGDIVSIIALYTSPSKPEE